MNLKIKRFNNLLLILFYQIFLRFGYRILKKANKLNQEYVILWFFLKKGLFFLVDFNFL